MYAKPVTVSATTCSSCGSSCEECEKAETLFSKGARPSYEFSNECQDAGATKFSTRVGCMPIWGTLFKVMHVKFSDVKNVTLNVSDVV